MASAYPNNTFVICGCFLSDRESFIVEGVQFTGKTYEGGDLVVMRRTVEHEFETCVVFGTGATRREARAKANTYLERIGRIHGLEDPTELHVENTQDL